jgi:hypothetical protein
VEYISASGNYLPPLIIMSGERYMSCWYGVEGLDDEALISVISIGYSNDEIAF